MMVKVPVSVGELFDKITILLIKKDNKIEGVDKELDLLNEISKKIQKSVILDALVSQLMNINQSLWSIEDYKRYCEKNKIFDDDFIDRSRAVYYLNDERARIKSKINQFVGSDIHEYKSHGDY